MSIETGSAIPTVPQIAYENYSLEECWWNTFVANRVGTGLALARRVARDIDLEPDPLAVVRRVVAGVAPAVELAGTSGEERRAAALFVSPSGMVVLVDGEGERAHVAVWAADHEAAERVSREIAAAFPRTKPAAQGRVPFTFWHCTSDRGEVELDLKDIECPKLADIEQNYGSAVRSALGRLCTLEKPDENGKIVLWFGPPGTGKTYAVRALAREWATRLHASVEVVLDPETLFGATRYLHRILLSEAETCEAVRASLRRMGVDLPAKEIKNPLRLVILEDAAELFSADCRATQGFARLLNLSEGIMGQGLRCVFLLTANEEVGRIDPALTRHGRCLQALEFPAFDPLEAAAWLDRHGVPGGPPPGPLTLAELFALRASRPPVAVRCDSQVGFASAR